MSESVSKDDLVQFLRNGEIEKFNSVRFNNNNGNFLDLTEIDLNNLKLSGADLSKVDLSGSDFSKSDIERINFSDSDLSSVNFSHTTIAESNFINSILEGSLLAGINVISGDFTEVDFNGVNICGANLSGADLGLCKNLMQSVYDVETLWPDNDFLPDEFEPENDMSFAELEDVDEFPEEPF